MAFCKFENVDINGDEFSAKLILNAAGGGRYLFDCSYNIADQSLNLMHGKRTDNTPVCEGELSSVIRFHVFYIIDAIEAYIEDHPVCLDKPV